LTKDFFSNINKNGIGKYSLPFCKVDSVFKFYSNGTLVTGNITVTTVTVNKLIFTFGMAGLSLSS